ncbi:hypothetical protein K438DRAFT_1939165 [Mycena galopus ATCC 62051]|nr:hypothetical protein K438DRAFT_1939165 [Mycena galopus ATCC 62051]
MSFSRPGFQNICSVNILYCSYAPILVCSILHPQGDRSLYAPLLTILVFENGHCFLTINFRRRRCLFLIRPTSSSTSSPPNFASILLSAPPPLSLTMSTSSSDVPVDAGALFFDEIPESMPPSSESSGHIPGSFFVPTIPPRNDPIGITNNGGLRNVSSHPLSVDEPRVEHLIKCRVVNVTVARRRPSNASTRKLVSLATPAPSWVSTTVIIRVLSFSPRSFVTSATNVSPRSATASSVWSITNSSLPAASTASTNTCKTGFMRPRRAQLFASVLIPTPPLTLHIVVTSLSPPLPLILSFFFNSFPSALISTSIPRSFRWCWSMFLLCLLRWLLTIKTCTPCYLSCILYSVDLRVLCL